MYVVGVWVDGVVGEVGVSAFVRLCALFLVTVAERMYDLSCLLGLGDVVCYVLVSLLVLVFNHR